MPEDCIQHEWVFTKANMDGNWDDDGSVEWLASREGKWIEFRLCLEHIICKWCDRTAASLMEQPHKPFHESRRD